MKTIFDIAKNVVNAAKGHIESFTNSVATEGTKLASNVRVVRAEIIDGLQKSGIKEALMETGSAMDLRNKVMKEVITDVTAAIHGKTAEEYKAEQAKAEAVKKAADEARKQKRQAQA